MLLKICLVGGKLHFLCVHLPVFRTDLITRWKDRTSRTSQLTNDESLSFQRALYRLWLYSAVYAWRQDNDEDEDDDGGDATATQIVETQRHSFLDSFTSSHLDDMEKVYEFLVNTATWVKFANWKEQGYDFIGSFLPFVTITISNHQLFSNRRLGASPRPTGGS
jgi:hypothetical protein